MMQGVFGLSVHKYPSARLYRPVYFAEHRNTISPPRPETCQTTRLGHPSQRQAAGPGLAPAALSMRLQTKSGRRWRSRPALRGPICMPPPSGSLVAGSRADCMTSLLVPRTGIPGFSVVVRPRSRIRAVWATTNRVSCAWLTIERSIDCGERRKALICLHQAHLSRCHRPDPASTPLMPALVVAVAGRSATSEKRQRPEIRSIIAAVL
jgi:hypothetical protein